LWWSGPSWLLESERWPETPTLNNLSAPERRKENIIVNVSTASGITIIDISRFSSLARLVRTLAFVVRFGGNARLKRPVRIVGPLTTAEVESALRLLLSQEQSHAFPSEVKMLINGKTLPVTSKLISLAPFYDKSSGLVRVGGRLKHSHLDRAARHPILLPRHSHLSTLIVLQTHTDCLHGGPQLTLACLSERYWIVSARDLIRRVIHSCVKCARYSRNIKPPFMADLPAARVNPSRPFTHTGLDYAGPFNIKTRAGRGVKITKAYLALFVCFATKATHLEVVSDATTDACLAAIRRFVSRRGLPAVIYSDNGKNFEGACNELSSLAKMLQTRSHNETFSNYASQNCFVWSFNPPSAPHFGGLWEAGVKSAKTHLRRVVGQTSLTFEELSTVFTQIEACLNSRPLTKLNADPNDLRPLTPGHFLTGDALLALPQRDLSGANEGRLARWHLLQKLVQDVWARWRSEYLATLLPRSKWHANSAAVLGVGSIVLLTDHCSPATWPLAVVTEVHPGKDDVVRVVTVRAGNRVYKRPIVDLRLLPTEDLLNVSVQGGRPVESHTHSDRQ
jgi:hypothetical protein